MGCHVKHWKHRNECMHDEDKQRKRVIEWYENVNSRIVNSEMTQLKMHVRRCKINLQQSTIEKIRRWIWNVKELEQKVEKTSQNDTKIHF